jgi:2-polyprenyl-6-methoxyphenol hydroxylase-like FAD-dependent oxidoreductase
VREVFARWHAPIPEIIEATEPAAILHNDIIDRPPIREWGKGRVTLLGDAAHPTTPNLGQGACQAMEDAIVLADCLRSTNETERALREYERRRRPRTTSVTNRSWRLGQISQWENPAACWMRNLITRCMPAGVSMRMLEQVLTAEIPDLH